MKTTIYFILFVFCIIKTELIAQTLSTSPTISFSNNSGFGDNIAVDGEGGSSAITDINIESYPINSSGVKLSADPLEYHDGTDWVGYMAIITYGSTNSNYGWKIASSNGAEFSLSALDVHDWGEWASLNLTVDAYLNGVFQGSINFIGNADGSYIHLNTGDELTSIFNNVDEIRFHRQDNTNAWLSLNNIQVSSPIVPLPEINLKGNTVSIVDNDATPSVSDHSDFGSQSICSGTIVRTFTIENIGNANLTLSNPTVSGTNAADFSVTANPSAPVSAAGSTTFQVAFNPSASGIRSATVSITNNDSDEGIYDFAIQGTGIDPEVNVQGNGNSIADGDATPTSTDHTDFGNQDMCSGTIVRTFTIQNTGNFNLTIANPTLSGTNAADFSVTANPSTPVSAAGSTTFDVTFNPSATGTRTATISFTSDDCDEATYNFDIQGTGIDGTPNADDPADVSACDSYELLPLTIGNYFTGAGGTGTALSAGNNITSTQTLFVYAINGSCTDENSFVVTINTTPTITGSTPSARCGTGTVDLGATSSAGVVNWYDDPTAGTLQGTGTTFTTPSISATTTYYAEANNSACLSASRTAVVATVDNNCTKTYLSLCGTRYENIGTAVVVYSVPGATMYKFEVVNGGTTQYIERSDRWFYFTQLGTWAYNTDYTIRVAAQVSGVYTAFGDACVVSTPFDRKIYANLCGSTMTNINTAITAYTVPGAVKYKFEVVNGGTTQYIERTERWFYFTQLGSYLYDTPYTIRVASSSDGTNFSAYGPTCVITTPAEKRIYANLCGATLASMNSAVTAYQVAGAVKYKFKVVNGGNTQYIERTDRWFYFTQLASRSYNTAYDVSVAISTDGTNFSTYGPVCVITTPASGTAKPNDNELELFTDFSLETYPNPNDGNFTISSTHEGQFNIINELGQLIQKVEITKENNFETKVEGLENGVYFITGTINDEIVTKKVMVIR